MNRILTIHCRQRELGLTLGEMLVVLAVFSILAIMFVSSSTLAIVKTKCSTALQEEHLLVDALRAYELDYGNIPSEAQGLDKLQSGYITSIPLDPFTKGSGTPKEYIYICDVTASNRFLIASVGPDGKSDIQNQIDEIQKKNISLSANGTPGKKVLMTPDELKNFVIQYSYDPSNGTISSGDVITLSGNQ